MVMFHPQAYYTNPNYTSPIDVTLLQKDTDIIGLISFRTFHTIPEPCDAPPGFDLCYPMTDLVDK